MMAKQRFTFLAML